jgi:tetratricopeptide (TPR) repeat protein
MSESTSSRSLRAITTLLEVGIAYASEGDFEKVQHIVALSVSFFPRDPIVLHLSGVAMMCSGDLVAALQYFTRALEAAPNMAAAAHDIGNIHYVAGNKVEALRWFTKAAESDPVNSVSARQAARVARELGDTFKALQILRRARTADPESPELVEELAELLVYHGFRPEAAQAYETVVLGPRARDQDHLRYMQLLSETLQFDRVLEHKQRFCPPAGSAALYLRDLSAAQARLASSFDRNAVLANAAALEGSPKWQHTGDVVEIIKSAIAARRPFSLVRFGDGEGRFLGSLDAALRRILTIDEAAIIADSIWNNWFGERFENADMVDVLGLQSAVVHSIESADIIGIATEDRLAKDGSHFGYLAYLQNVVTGVSRRNSGQWATDAAISYQLHEQTPFYREVLVDVNCLCVISPHPRLAQRLGSYFRIRGVTSYVIPGEMRLPPNARGHGPVKHFPDRYYGVLNELAVPSPGTVFLVAAGLLGKVYCSRIKELGGIAIDIGAVADGWMGFFDTRPGQYKDPKNWALPEDANDA